MKRRRRSGQRGDAMVLVILAVLLLTLIPAALVAATIGQVPQAREEQQYQGALAAAQAGVADYLNLLDQASVDQTQDYWTFDANNLPPGGNAAMTSWEAVPGSSSEYFHYTVDNTNTAKSGVVTLTSTGVAVHGIETEYETVRVEIRSDTFLNYVDMMSQMLIDPQFAPDVAGMSTNQAETYCEYNYDQYNPSTGTDGPLMPSSCSGLINYYSSGEIVNGAIFTNDIYYLTGNPVFNGPVLSGSSKQTPYAAHPYWLDPLNYYYHEGVYDDPQFNDGPIQYHAPLQFPTANAQLATIAQKDGCYYEGPTVIDFTGQTMTVDSPETTTATNGCPTDGPGNLPGNGVIYIAPDSGVTQSGCTLDLEGQNHPCADGDALVQGDVTGQVTIAATNNVDITGNLLDHGCAQPGSSSVIGLIADNFVQVEDNVFGGGPWWDPTPATNVTPNSCAGEPGDNATTNEGNDNTLVVQAAILALNQSFAVQDFWNIPLQGNLDLDGSIAGYYADIEGSFDGSNGQLTNGYNAIYTYDSRLTYMQPPYFLTPVAADWQKISFTQIYPPSGLPALP